MSVLLHPDSALNRRVLSALIKTYEATYEPQAIKGSVSADITDGIFRLGSEQPVRVTALAVPAQSFIEELPPTTVKPDVQQIGTLLEELSNSALRAIHNNRLRAGPSQ